MLTSRSAHRTDLFVGQIGLRVRRYRRTVEAENAERHLCLPV
jgi:hypothetical protein